MMRFLFVAIIATVSVLMAEARYDRYREDRTRDLPQTYEHRDRGHHGPHERGHHGPHERGHHGPHERGHRGSHERHHHGRHHDSHDRQHHRDHYHHRPDPRREHHSSWRDLGRAYRDRFDRYGYYNYERAMRPSYGFLDSLRNRYESTHRRGRHNSRSSSSSSSSSSEEERYDRRKCNKQTEQPSYTVQCVSPDGYEVREYEEAMWVTTVVNTTSYEEGGRIGFRRLFSYISGDNSQNVRIKMTIPVRKRIIREEDGESSYQNNLYSVSFFVPPKFFNNTPEPLNNEIFIELESSYVYAFNFSGWAYESRITEMYNNLSDFLEETDQPMVASEFSVQGFDGPRSSSGRHNEILIPVDSDFGEPTCGPTTTEQPTMLPPNGITQCLRNECPTYTERSSLSDRIVIREVSAGVYATKRSTTCNMSAVMDETYTPLRNYFLGSNSERLRIPTTVPILQLGVRPERVSASCNFTYQTSFYIPERYQKAPPTPDDETVFISSADAMSYYVLTFEESPTPNIAFSKYTELATFLRESDLCFFPGNFQLAFYDAPWRPLPHRYEVWIPLAKTCGNDVMDGSIEILFPQTEDENLIMPALNGDPTV